MSPLVVLLIVIVSGSLFSFFVFFRINRSLKEELEDHTKTSSRRMYELAILKELGERAGYSLDVQKIIDIITGSLGQLIDYNAVAYMIVNPEKVDFKIHLEKSVSRKFIDDVRGRMIKSLSALLNREFTVRDLQETVSGAIMVEELDEPVRSFFNIPLVIGDKVVGILTIANTKAGLYKEDEMTILYKITNQASQAVARLQNVVEREQGKLNAMVESMGEGVVMTDIDYRILVANPASRRALGIDLKKKDISIFDFIDSLSGAFDIRGKLEESVKLNKILMEKEVFLKDRFFQIVVSPVKNKAAVDGEVLGGVVIFHDITSEKQVEKIRDDFTSMLVHELRTPLDGIKKMTEAISGESDLKEETRGKYVKLIHTNTSRMLGLVNDILDVAKFESGTFSISKSNTALPELINDVVRLFEAVAKDKSIKLKSVLAESLPKIISSDSQRLTQVLSNLISNSLKFTPSGGEVILSAFLHNEGSKVADEIDLSSLGILSKDEKALQSLDSGVVIVVSDTGVGIRKNDISKLFDKFKQFHANTSVAGSSHGTGLGLVISKQIIEAHGGSIKVVSLKNEGSSFYFSLPYDQAEMKKAAAEKTSREAEINRYKVAEFGLKPDLEKYKD